VTLVNVKTNETPQTLTAPDIAAIGAWQPVAGQAMKLVPGSHPVYTSADQPGLIYDVLAVKPASAKARRAEWLKVVKVWTGWWPTSRTPRPAHDAVRILAARSGVSPAEYLPLLKGTRLLSLAEGRKVYVKGDGFGSLYGSTRAVNEFNVGAGVYKAPEPIEAYLDPSFTAAN
jgi:NitT/TauT family transport system substrate-binding protein